MRCEPVVTVSDKQRIISRIETARSRWSTYAPYLDWFRTGLNTAQSLSPNDVPGDIITMNTRFSATDLRSGESRAYTLVYPEDEAPDDGKLCVLSPMGMALLGARVGDIVRWTGVRSIRAMEVDEILYQPEAAGDLEL